MMNATVTITRDEVRQFFVDIIDSYKRLTGKENIILEETYTEPCTDGRIRTLREIYHLPLPIREVVYNPYDNANRDIIFEVMEEMKTEYVKKNNITPAYLEPADDRYFQFGKH